MVDAAVEIGEQRGGFGGDDSGFEVGAGKAADGVEGTPGGLDEDFHFAFHPANGNDGSEVAGDASEVRADQRRKMVPAARSEGAVAASVEEAGCSLPTTTFQGRTSHFFARPFTT